MLALVPASVQVGRPRRFFASRHAVGLSGTCALLGSTQRHQGRVCADTGRFDERTGVRNILAVACFESSLPPQKQESRPGDFGRGGMGRCGLPLFDDAVRSVARSVL
jgi:hypothetical protein